VIVGKIQTTTRWFTWQGMELPTTCIRCRSRLYPTPVGEGLVASLPQVIDPLELPRTGAAWVGREWNGFASQGAAYLRCPQSPGQGLRFGRPHSIPTIYEWHEFANAGGLMTYGVSLTDAQAAARCGAGIERR
jgi:hypothetical protein